MRRVGIALAAGFLCTTSLASAQKSIDITPDSIAGIRLGMTQAQAKTFMTRPIRVDRIWTGYTRLVSPRQKVEVYFRRGAKGAVVVSSWNRRFKTSKQIGTCSTRTALKAAYGAQLKPDRGEFGRVIAYRLGDLIFHTDDGLRIENVALGRGQAPTFVAYNRDFAQMANCY